MKFYAILRRFFVKILRFVRLCGSVGLMGKLKASVKFRIANKLNERKDDRSTTAANNVKEVMKHDKRSN